jgi:hypothetical protein
MKGLSEDYVKGFKGLSGGIKGDFMRRFRGIM